MVATAENASEVGGDRNPVDRSALPTALRRRRHHASPFHQLVKRGPWRLRGRIPARMDESYTGESLTEHMKVRSAGREKIKRRKFSPSPIWFVLSRCLLPTGATLSSSCREGLGFEKAWMNAANWQRDCDINPL